MAIYSKATLSAVKAQRKKRAEKAKKKLEQLALSSPVIREMIKEKAVQMGYILSKRLYSSPAAFDPIPAYVQGMGNLFYKTREWRQLRYKVLVKFGRKCMCCGETAGHIHVDHIQPRSLHPHLELDESNLQVLCEACNMGKSNKDSTDFR